jgi:sporulation protein YlmC with PRC-barrel domain
MTQGTTVSPATRLAALADTGAAVLSSEDVRGSDVRDPAAEKIGTVEDLILDTVTGRVRFLRVGSGGLLGLGKTHRLIPVDAVTDVVQGAVFLDRSRERVEDAPTEHGSLDEDYIRDVYAFFGYQPFWSSEYRQPDWTGRQ